jgi:hypothetical protein
MAGVSLPMAGAACEGYGVPVLPAHLRGVVQVLLDEGPVDNVVAYSAFEGWVVRHLYDTKGRPVIQGDCVATERLTGEVKVKQAVRRG